MEILKKGTAVTWPAPANEGVVMGVKLAEDGESAQYLIEFVNADGETHHRWFDARALTVKESGQ